jgi:hypothetical protein
MGIRNLAPRLDSTLFSYDRYEGELWEYVEGIGEVNNETRKEVLQELVLGYCPANELAVRPRSDDEVAIMLNLNGASMWAHMGIEDFKAMFEEES